MPLPQKVTVALSHAKPRPDPECVDHATAKLGVSVSNTFREFYRTYRGPFGSKNTGFLLLDLSSGRWSIVSSTEVVRSDHGIPHEYLVITDLLGGGVLMYKTDTDQVFDVDFEGGHELLIAGTLPPTWNSFEAFLDEYFG
jgi:hypothetical protein